MVFPNLKNKHAKDSMFSPREFIAYSKQSGWCPKIKVPKGVIICYNRELIEFIKFNHKTKKYSAFGGNLYILTKSKGKLAVIGEFGIGAPVASIVLEELIALGVSRFISIGTAGTLQKELDIGDIIVCNRAIRDEGTSHHYLKYSKYSYASKELTKDIVKVLKKLNQKFTIGATWTIDAPYRETVVEARQYQKEGVLTVEMEASALFAIAKYRRVKLASILTVSDSLAELEWKPKFHAKKTKEGLKLLFELAKEVLLGSH